MSVGARSGVQIPDKAQRQSSTCHARVTYWPDLLSREVDKTGRLLRGQRGNAPTPRALPVYPRDT